MYRHRASWGSVRLMKMARIARRPATPTPGWSWRVVSFTLLSGLALLSTAGCTQPGVAPSATVTAADAAASTAGSPLRYLGQQIVPSLKLHAGVPFGGLSGVDCEPGTTRCVALSDDRANLGPARFYTLELDLAAFERRADAGADAGADGVRVLAAVPIGHPEGRTWARGETDPESIRLTPEGRLLWTDEGQRSRAPFLPPALREMDREGRHLRSFSVPAPFLTQGSPGGEAAGDSGVRDNLAFDRATGRPGPQHAYRLEPVPLAPQPADGPAGNGLVELLALDDLRHDDGTPLATDNIEAIAWGPRHQGQPTLLLVSDNNFNPRQFTQLLVLTVHGELADAALRP